MSDLDDEIQREIAARLKDLRPAVEESEGLQAAAEALHGVTGSTPPVSTSSRRKPARAGRRPGRPRGSRSRATRTAPPPAAASAAKSAPARKRRRGGTQRKAGGTRVIQAVSIIAENPGITIAELAKKMGIRRTGLYRILPGPELEGKIRREGSGWHPA